jgi:tRNA(Ile)-lysidine synthase TilS/MesJ
MPTDSPFSSLPTVSVVNAHGRQLLTGRSDERLIDLLSRNNVPWSAVAVYVLPKDGGEPRLAASLDLTLGEFEDAAEILLYFNRNVNPFMFSIDRFRTIESDHPGLEATEYVYQRMDNEAGGTESFLKKLSPEECKSIIADRVGDTVRQHLPRGAHIVVGVSGGGDSNAMLYGLSKLADHDITVHPVILKGIPDWDAGVPRAQVLCDTYGLELTVIEAGEVKELLGIPSDSVDLIDRFEAEFQGDDFEFMGTLLIRLALSKAARDLGTPYICTGVNLEDIVCENLYRVSNGLQPAGFPLREIDDVTLVLPLWLCPKRIIDGCFPKFSLENYDARYPCFSLGRNLYYSVVYSLQSQFPGYLEQLARGLSKLSMENPVRYTYNEQLGFPVERSVPFPLLRRFQKMLTGAAPTI